MSRLFYHTMQDNAGNLLFGVTGTMRVAGSGTLATIYGDEALTVPIANPMTNHPSFGSFKCYLGPGSYDFYLAKAGYTFETLTGAQGGGSMASQDKTAVDVTGGTGYGLTSWSATQLAAGSNVQPGYALAVTGAIAQSGGNVGFGGTPTVPMDIFGLTRINAPLGLQRPPQSNTVLHLGFNKASQFGMALTPLDTDTTAPVMQFNNVAGTGVGSITTTGSATAYNTASDARLKHAVETLTGELDLIRALRPVRFLWNVDDTPGVGFLAAEVAAHVQGVIVGEEGAVDEAGAIKPQMIDYAQLVPYLVGAIKTLTARLAVLEDALGV